MSDDKPAAPFPQRGCRVRFWPLSGRLTVMLGRSSDGKWRHHERSIGRIGFATPRQKRLGGIAVFVGEWVVSLNWLRHPKGEG